ncbi:minor capsid protein [Streptococcus pneumoniae]|nr:minor capsid protein [Streptococcus pneumoniae]
MKNQEYWAKRKANLIYQQMDKAEKQADQFDKVYQEAKTYLDKEVNKIFDKFQRDYGLSQVDARQVLKNMKDKKDLNELRKVLEARPNDPNIQRLLADLDSPAYSFRMKRLERLSDDLDRMRESIYHSEKTGSDAFYSDLMKDSYYKATFDLQQQTGLAYGFSGLPESEIKHLQSFSWVGDGSTYSTDIWKNTGKLTSSIKDELLMSLMTGRDTRETAQAIAERFNVGQNDARRLVRTESAFFHNQMELLSYEEADIEKYIFVAVLDKRTSRICQEHDNQVYDRDKAVPGVNCPPMHPWCRSTTVAYDEDADYSKLKRRARNPETGKVEYVPADMTYKEWYSKYVDGNRESIKRKAFDKTIKDGIIVSVSGTTIGHTPPGKIGLPNSVVQHNATNGDVLGRTYYDARGFKTKDVHFTNHKQPARHPYGKIGEHAHDFVFDDEGKFVSRSTRELTDDERKENQDILWRY